MRTQAEIEDRDHIMDLRYKATYKGYKNSIVEWTLSDEWLDADPYTNSVVNKRGSVYMNRGVCRVNICSGEC